MINAIIRFCPSTGLTFEEEWVASQLPSRGDTIESKAGDPFVVTRIFWSIDKSSKTQLPMIIAHSPDRPGAQAARGY